MKKQCLLACLLCLTLILFPGCSFLSDLLLPGSADPADPRAKHQYIFPLYIH